MKSFVALLCLQTHLLVAGGSKVATCSTLINHITYNTEKVNDNVIIITSHSTKNLSMPFTECLSNLSLSPQLHSFQFSVFSFTYFESRFSSLSPSLNPYSSLPVPQNFSLYILSVSISISVSLFVVYLIYSFMILLASI